MIYHITTRKQWNEAKQKGVYTAPSLVSEGFIHCSTLNQTVDTANLFFKGQSELVLLCIDEKRLKAVCKFEDPSGISADGHDPRVDKLFPHVYGPINHDAIIKTVDFPVNENGTFELPRLPGLFV